MAGSLDAARDCIQRTQADLAASTGLTAGLSDRIEEILAQLSGSGPLGSSDDPHLGSCRSHLSQARQRLVEARQHLELVRGALTRLVERAFPP